MSISPSQVRTKRQIGARWYVDARCLLISVLYYWKFQSDKIVNFYSTAYDTLGWNLAAEAINDANEIVATVVYADDAQRSTIKTSRSPTLQHFAGGAPDRPQRTAALTIYQYSGVKSYLFATPFQELFNYTTEAISHTRNIMHLKKNMQGPYFDLELIWDEHTYYEFADRSVEHTMSTMVQEPYVNHVPTVSTFRCSECVCVCVFVSFWLQTN